MPSSPCYLFKNSMEYLPAADIRALPSFLRGIYVLYNASNDGQTMEVVYIGMARGEASGIKGRLVKHRSSSVKQGKWSHFSVFEVWDNITQQQIEELEGFFRHVYAKDNRANVLNTQRRHAPLSKIRRKSKDDWVQVGVARPSTTGARRYR